jgi:2-haloacid dehalogenase
MSALHSTPAALVFDAYGTLYDVRSVAASCERRLPGHGAALTELWRRKQLEYSWLCGLMGRHPGFWSLTEAGLRHACRALGLALAPDAARELMNEYLRLACYPEVPGALARLAERLPLAILSNGTADMLAAVTAHNGLTGRFRHILSADEAGVFKPSPRVYRLAVERLGLPPGRIGFVSSNGWDAAGAKAAGLTVYWINRQGLAPEELGLAPDREIRTLDDLAAIMNP